MKYGVMIDTPSTPSRSAIFVRRITSRVVSAPVPGINGNAVVDVSDGGGDDFLLFALIQSVKLAIGAEDEDAMNAVFDEMVEEPFQTGNVEVLVGQHRRGDGRNNALDTHDCPSRNG